MVWHGVVQQSATQSKYLKFHNIWQEIGPPPSPPHLYMNPVQWDMRISNYLSHNFFYLVNRIAEMFAVSAIVRRGGGGEERGGSDRSV